MKTLWNLRQKVPSDGRSYKEVAREIGVSPVTVRCMCNRGVTDPAAMRLYLDSSMSYLHDPMSMKGMADAVELLIRELFGTGERDFGSGQGLGCRIAIASDYDCDGIFSAYILKLSMELLGAEAHIFTPDRVAEGYGLNRRIVDDAFTAGCGLILTCDNGIAATDAITYAKERGMRVLVTDHHEPQEVLPPADVILDPKQKGDEYPFKGLCGAGVAYKLISALFKKVGDMEFPGNEVGGNVFPAPPSRSDMSELMQEMLAYVSIATVADVMELVDENRILVKHGLEKIERTTNPGLRALMREQGIEDATLNPGHIGFIIGPCFNAAGRLTTVRDSFDVLMAADYDTAETSAKRLKEINEVRKKMTDESVDEGIKMLLETFPGADDGDIDDIILIYLPGVHESIVGLVAGKIKERFNHPVVVFTDAHPIDGIEGDLIKGSGRSIPAYHMFDGINRCSDLMVRFGGHAMAAGLTIKKEDLDELRERLNSDSRLEKKDFIPVLTIDLAMPVSYASESIIAELESMGPFGNGNPRPVFAEKGFTIKAVRYMGENDRHVKLRVCNTEGVCIDAVAFSRGDEFRELMKDSIGTDDTAEIIRRVSGEYTIALAYQPEVNEYRDMRSIQMKINDWVIEHK